MDTTRRDHCSVYGYERETTPHLTALAREGARFDLAYAPMATTAPTHATIFTSLYPIAHRVVTNAIPLAPQVETLAEILAARGYQTAAVVSSFVLDARFGYAQGFGVWDDDFDGETSTFRRREFGGQRIEHGFDRRGDETTRRAVRWLEAIRERARPFLLFVHYFDPHDPYTPPRPFVERFARAPEGTSDLPVLIGRYDGEIAFMDAAIGDLLAAVDRLRLARETLVVVTADHGEGLMQHGAMTHGVHIYDEQVRVPLVVRWRGQIPPRVVDAPVELVDLLPTVLDLLGVDGGGRAFQGRSLAAALRDGAPLDAERAVFLHRRPYPPDKSGPIRAIGEQFGIRHGRWKYIEGREEGTWQLFDLEADPGERVNLHDVEAETAAALAGRLEAWRQAHAVGPPGLPSHPLTDDERARLRALGYVD
jgi:arylsulfatase A-like enzyme